MLRRRYLTADEAAAAAALSHHGDPLDPITVTLAQTKGLPGRLSASDRALLRAASAAPVDVETLDVDSHAILWIVFHKLLDLWVDPADRVWLRTTKLGEEVLRLDPKGAAA